MIKSKTFNLTMKIPSFCSMLLLAGALLFGGIVKAQVVSFPDSIGQRKGSFFPLMRGFKQKAVEAGAEFPKPYGLAGSMYFQQQNMEITKIRLGNLELSEEGGIIDFDDSKIKNTVTSSQIRADVWVLPFVNVYGMMGRVTTFNNIDLSINLNNDNIPNLSESISLLKERTIANINGTVGGAGMVVAGGYGKVFANVNITWAQTWLSEVNSIQKSFVAFPMVGMTTSFANLFVGGIYQNTGTVNKGSFQGSTGNQINYELEYSAQRWNYTIGFNKSIGNWSMVIIQGFGARTNSVIEVGYRFGD
jgi:hypothetical protein